MRQIHFGKAVALRFAQPTVFAFFLGMAALVMAVTGRYGEARAQTDENYTVFEQIAKPPTVSHKGMEWCGGGLIRRQDAKIGGISDMLLEGNHWMGLSDRAEMVEGTLIFSRKKKSLYLEDLSEVVAHDLLDAKGEKLPMRMRDSEGLATAEQTGEYWMSFERKHRLQRFERGDEGWRAVGDAVPLPLNGKGQDGNLGVETIVNLGDGTWWLVAENAAFEGHKDASTLWIFDGERLTESRPYQESEGFMPTAAVRWDEMHLLVLERKLTLFEGFRSRLRLVEIGHEDVVGPVIEVTNYIMHDNAEDLAVMPSQDGEKLVLIGSDDNFQLWQSSWLVGLCMTDEAFAAAD